MLMSNKQMLCFDVTPVFIFRQNLMSTQCWSFTSNKWALTSTWFLFPTKIWRLPNVGAWCQTNVLWRKPDFCFQPNFDVCPTLELAVKQTLWFGVNLIFVFNQNLTSVQCWSLTSNKCCVLRSTWLSFSNKMWCLANVGSPTSWRYIDIQYLLELPS